MTFLYASVSSPAEGMVTFGPPSSHSSGQKASSVYAEGSLKIPDNISMPRGLDPSLWLLVYERVQSSPQGCVHSATVGRHRFRMVKQDKPIKTEGQIHYSFT